MAICPPPVPDRVAYSAMSDGKIHAINLETGSELWQVKLTNQNISAPAIADGMLFFADSNDVGYGSLVALDQATGAEKWRFETEHDLR